MVYYLLSPDEASGACGLLAQLVEHIVHIDGVTGSSPVQTTIIKPCKCLHGFSFSRKVFEFTSMEVFDGRRLWRFQFLYSDEHRCSFFIFIFSDTKCRRADCARHFSDCHAPYVRHSRLIFCFHFFPLYKTAVKFLGLTVVFLYSPSSSALISMTLPPSFS